MLMIATVAGEYAGVTQRLHVPLDAAYLKLNYRLIREITEESGVDAKMVPWRKQEFLVILQTEDGKAHVLDHIIGNDARLEPWESLLMHTKCSRISDHVYKSNATAPLCANTISQAVDGQYDISAFRGHFVTLKILLKDDLSPVARLSDVQDVYALVDRVFLANKDLTPVVGH